MKTELIDRFRSLYSTVWRDIHGVETTRRPIDEHIQAAIGWLYRSQDATEGGGSAADYNLIFGWNNPYPETTGYIIPTLYNVAEKLDLDDAGERARSMADWLIGVQQPKGSYPAGTNTGARDEPSVFNTGQILRGLIRTYQETGESVYRQHAMSAIDWLADVQHENGYWDVHDYHDRSHAYSSRISWPLLEASQEFADGLGEEVAMSNLVWVLEQQRENGWFDKTGFKNRDQAFLHTIAYTIRGLLESAAILDGGIASECEKAAVKAADELLNQQETGDILFGSYDANWRPTGDYRCLSGNAQIAMVWARLFEQSNEKKYLNAVEDTLAYLMDSQTLHGPRTIYGGFRGSDPVWGRYMYLRYPNWSTKFFIDVSLAYTHNLT